MDTKERRSFLKRHHIREKIQNSGNYCLEELASCAMLLLYAEAEQRTWIVGSYRYLYFVTDDIRKPSAELHESYSLVKVLQDDRLRVRMEDSDHENEGKIYFCNSDKSWLYSKSLFDSEQKLYERINSFVHLLASHFKLTEVTHPGVILSEKLKEFCVSVQDFAVRIDVPEDVIKEIIAGQRNITEELAQKFYGGIPAMPKFWIVKQRQYDEVMGRENH